MPERKTPWLKQVSSQASFDSPYPTRRQPVSRDEQVVTPTLPGRARSEDSLSNSITIRSPHLQRQTSSRAPFADLRSPTPIHPQTLPPLRKATPRPKSEEGGGTFSLLDAVVSFLSTAAWFLSGMVRLVRIILGMESCVLRHYSAAGTAKTYSEWFDKVRSVDQSRGFSNWRDGPEDRSLYDHSGLTERLQELKSAHALAKDTGNYADVLELLSDGINRTTYGITYSELYRKYRSGTKGVIEEYQKLIQVIVKEAAYSATHSTPAIRRHSGSDAHNPLGDSPSLCVSASSGDDEGGVKSSTPSVRAVFSSLKRCEHLYGNVALILNGSIALGLYHLGVVEALRQADCLPAITLGTNTGAIVAALIGCRLDYASALDPEKANFDAFKNKSSKGGFRRKVDRFLKEGTLMDVAVLTNFVRDNVGTMTFAEAFAHTGRVLNIQVGFTVGPSKSFWLLNHLTAPHVLVYSAAVLSCATRGVYNPIMLMCKLPSGEVVPYDIGAYRFASSAVNGDLNCAVERMRQLFNVRLFLISECSFFKHPGIGIAQRKGFFFQFLHFFTEEFWRFLAAVSRRKHLQTRFTHTLQDMVAEYPEPCMVIHPASKLRDFRVLIQNPDKVLLEKCELAGARVVWPRVEEIRAHVGTASALEAAIQKLSKEFPDLIGILGE